MWGGKKLVLVRLQRVLGGWGTVWWIWEPTPLRCLGIRKFTTERGLIRKETHKWGVEKRGLEGLNDGPIK